MDRELKFSSIDQGLTEARRLVMAGANGAVNPEKGTGFTLAQTLEHCAQSIDFAIDGFPAMKPALFRATVGAAAFAVFSLRGRMSHGLADPIPGAPLLDAAADAAEALARLVASADRFERYTGVLAPHFAYGQLSKSDYAKANAMHLANHFSAVEA